ncbi:MAG: sensor protein [Myxococcaceae bacterium]|jgi:PAS domain S-box-containing protein|nr:sensor protein [Myxococcaceae bacterium]MEA2747785.1 two-component system, NtrC family, sensor kinase [Myxococcales bacterium]
MRDVASSARLSEPMERLEEIADALFRIASLDFDHPLECRGDETVLDGVVGCINMLAEELRAHLDARARASQELEASVERYRTLVESTNVVPWEVDATLTVSYVAPQVAVMFGEPPSRFVGNTSLWECTHPDDRARVRTSLEALVASRDEHANLDYRIVRGDGRTIDVRSIVSVHRGSDKASTTLRGVTVDTTMVRQLEGELQQARKLEAVGRLAAGIAHEINTPIQFVGDNLAFAGQSLDALLRLYGRTSALLTPAQAETARQFEQEADYAYLSEEVPKAIAESVGGIAHVAEIVRAMKTFSHQERSCEQAPVNLNAALEAVVAVARSETRDFADVVLELADIPPVIAFGSDLNQVFLNLIVNAAHAVADVVGQSGERGTIRVRTERAEDDVLIAIEDTGGGIPDAIRERVFEPFFTTKGVGVGTGQGLALARAVVVERHGGTLTFVSEGGRGTTFLVRVPVAGRPKAPHATG